MVEIKGEIASGGEASAELVVSAMQAAFEDEGARAVVRRNVELQPESSLADFNLAHMLAE